MSYYGWVAYGQNIGYRSILMINEMQKPQTKLGLMINKELISFWCFTLILQRLED